jgi:sec-independent protein translocase protein TatC
MAESESLSSRMTLWEHLHELRTRLVHSAIAVVAAFAILYMFRFRLWNWTQQPFLEALARQTRTPIAQLQPWAFTDLMEPFISLMRLTFWAAAFVVAPYLFYQLWGFIRPALREQERRLVIPFVLVTSSMFVGGAAFSYCYAFKFIGDILFLEASRAGLRANLHIDSYLDLFLYTLLSTGIMFEMPVLAFFLAKFRIITVRWMLKFWRHCTIVILLVSAFLTPGDVVATMIFFSVILEAVYFVSLAVVWVVQPRKAAEPEAPS